MDLEKENSRLKKLLAEAEFLKEVVPVAEACDVKWPYTHATIRKIEEWINRYLRKILDFKTTEELFALELASRDTLHHRWLGILMTIYPVQNH